MSDDFEEQLNGWLEQVTNDATVTLEEQAQITGAGAEVFAKSLEQHTPYDANRQHKHLRDSIIFDPGKTVDGKAGDTDVGFTENKAYIARFLNDGTKKMVPTHFREEAEADSKNSVLAAMEAKYRELKGE